MKVAISALLALCLFGFARCEYNRDLFKQMLINDSGNDDAIELTAQGLIERSGFQYENHYVAADDGYITNIVHLINPLADRKKLHKVPVLMFHGFNVDMASYLAVSSKQHHPEPWPRAEGQKTTSSQRSVAFALANEGYDVWLIGTRGSNAENKRYAADPKVQAKINSGDYSPLSSLESRELEDLPRLKHSWLHGLDEIISLDLDSQINKVKELTGSEEVTIYTYSLSTPTLMAFLARARDQAREVRNFIQVGPAIPFIYFTFLDPFYYDRLCPSTLDLAPSFFPAETVRKSIIEPSNNQKNKYATVPQYLRALFGPSRDYQTNLETNVLSHVFKQISSKSFDRYCEQPEQPRNIFAGSNVRVPAYEVSDLRVQNWVLVSGTNDIVADPNTVEKLKSMVHTPKPPKHIDIPEYNHLDLLAGTEVDEYVSRPVIKILNQNSD